MKLKEKKETIKNSKGITLIALVVTIIVLIILAGVSINLVLGDNGILTKAKDAKAQSEEEKVLEEVKLSTQSYLIDRLTGNQGSLEAALINELDSIKIEQIKISGTVAKLTYKGENIKVNLETGEVSLDEEFELWNDAEVSEGLYGKGTEQDPFLIYNIADFNYFIQCINNEAFVKCLNTDGTIGEDSTTYAKMCHYKLMTNIALNNIDNYSEWSKDTFDRSTLNRFQPIGNIATNNLSFMGTFDGNGNEITGMYIDTSVNIKENNYGNYYGLFAALYNATVKNLIVTNVYIDKTTESFGNTNRTGTIVGSVDKSTISNCYCSGYIKGSNESWYAGGIVGTISGNAIVKDCINEVIIDNGVYSGGICAQASSSIIENCTNKANLWGATKLAGIVGETTSVNIINCNNEGNITTNDASYHSYIAGIGGSVYTTNIENSINTGTITVHEDTTQCGGIAGLMGGYKLVNCINKGNIGGNAKNVGGLIGMIYINNYGNFIIENCKNEGQITTTNALNDLVGECSKYEDVIVK